MKVTSSKVFVHLILLCVMAPPGYAQEGPQKASDDPVRLHSELVVLDAQTISRRTKRAVGRLEREDFLLYEDGVRQHIAQFSNDGLPLSIVLMLDLVGEACPIIELIRSGALRALDRLKPEDEVALMLVSCNPYLIQDFTNDKQLIRDKIKMAGEPATRVSEAIGNIHSGVHAAALHLQRYSRPMSRRVIIAITDDYLEPFHSLNPPKAEVLKQLSETGAVVSALIVKSPYNLSKPVQLVIDANPAVLLAKRFFKILSDYNVELYANRTGGEVVLANEEQIDEQLGELIEKMRAHYSFGYISSNQKRDGRFRKIKLKVSASVEKREGGVAIATRKGYYTRRKESKGSDRQEKR